MTTYINQNGTIKTDAVEEHIARMVLISKATELGVPVTSRELILAPGGEFKSILRPLILQMCRHIFRDSDINDSAMGVDIVAPPAFMRIMQFALNGFNMQLEIPAAARFNRSKLIEVIEADPAVGPIFTELMDFMRNNVAFRPQYAFFQRIVRIPVSNAMLSGADKPFARILPLVTYLFTTKGIVDRMIGAMGCDLNAWFERALEGESEREIQSLRDIVARGVSLAGDAVPAIPTVNVPAAVVAEVANTDAPPATARFALDFDDVRVGDALSPIITVPVDPAAGTRAASAAEQARLAQVLAEMGLA